MDPKLSRLNSLPTAEAQAELLKCCGSKSWTKRLLHQRPFTSMEDLTAKADQVWWSLESADWLEAFLSHPKIGEKKAAADTARLAREWSANEQSGMRDSSAATVDELARFNRVYEDKFGFIFIVCASGKSSEEMLAILKDRVTNEREDELQIAAGEQAKITQLRLRKLLESPPT